MGLKGRTLNAKLILPHSEAIGIFHLFTKTINSLWASIACFTPSVPVVPAVIILHKFLLNVRKKSLKAFGDPKVV